MLHNFVASAAIFVFPGIILGVALLRADAYPCIREYVWKGLLRYECQHEREGY